jgi:hypothetical protein
MKVSLPYSLKSVAIYSTIHYFTVSCVEKVDEVYFVFSLKWGLCLVSKDKS